MSSHFNERWPGVDLENAQWNENEKIQFNWINHSSSKRASEKTEQMKRQFFFFFVDQCRACFLSFLYAFRWWQVSGWWINSRLRCTASIFSLHARLLFAYRIGNHVATISPSDRLNLFFNQTKQNPRKKTGRKNRQVDVGTLRNNCHRLYTFSRLRLPVRCVFIPFLSDRLFNFHKFLFFISLQSDQWITIRFRNIYLVCFKQFWRGIHFK